MVIAVHAWCALHRIEGTFSQSPFFTSFNGSLWKSCCTSLFFSQTMSMWPYSMTIKLGMQQPRDDQEMTSHAAFLCRTTNEIQCMHDSS